MSLITRAGKGSELTVEDMDGNLYYLAGTLSGSIQITGSIISDINSTGNITAVSMSGDGSGLTGVTGEWDGTHVGDASITGSLTVTGGVNGVTGSFSHLQGNSPITIQDPTTFQSAITASGNISSSGTIIANKIESANLVSHLGDANTGIAFGNDTVVIESNDSNVAVFQNYTQTIGNNAPFPPGTFTEVNIVGTSLNVSSNITASGNISSSADIYGTTGSFGTMVLTSPDGTKYSFSTNNSGHLQLTGSIVP